MQNAKCKMQNANANAKGKCNRLSVKPFIATALFNIAVKKIVDQNHPPI